MRDYGRPDEDQNVPYRAEMLCEHFEDLRIFFLPPFLMIGTRTKAAL